MRGIEAALNILTHDNGTGQFATEALRKLADREKMKGSDISLASSLIYIVMRRKELWEKIADDYIRSRENLPESVLTALTTGIGGLLELRRFSGGVLINGIIEYLKRDKSLVKYSSLVNAILHKIIEENPNKLEKFSKSSSLQARAMFAGVPVWTLPEWSRTWNNSDLFNIFEMMNNSCYSSLRISPGKIFDGGDLHFHVSEISGAINLNQSILPLNVPGFNEGICTVQSESSILAASLVSKFYSGRDNILDMCSGRGIKAGQILQENESAKLECWELSEKRSKSAEHELERLGVRERAIMKIGDALNLEPFDEKISFVVLDAPCSCSGTWNRKPESKWRLDRKKLNAYSQTQKKLLERAVNLCGKGGYILYITCSLLKQENENVIAEVLAKYPELAEVSSLINWNGNSFKKGKPYGIYILPVNSWLDGFYCSLILKR